MIRFSSLSRWFAAVVVAAIGCHGAASDQTAGTEAVRAGDAEDSTNPFAGSGRVPESGEAAGATMACVELRLDAVDVVRGDAVNSRLHVENHCDAAIAVLTAPLEVEVLERADQPATWPMSHAVYTVLYIQPKADEEPRINYLADGGLRVLRLPKYFSVRKGASAEIPVLGGHEALRQLPVGAYWLVLQAPVVLAPEADPMETPFDLAQSVERHNSRSGDDDTGGQMILMPGGAERMGAATTLRILPEANKAPASS